MTSPLISIVLPTYNGARFLKQSVESCLAQSYTNYELIIVDDASTDSTPALIHELQCVDSRIRTLRHAQNSKLPAALNSGFAIARGDYLTWTSDDNLYRPEALATMIDFLENNPSVDMVYTDYTEIDDQNQPVQQRRVEESDRLIHSNIIGASFLYRRKVQQAIGPYAEDLFLAEDYDYWLRVSAAMNLRPLHVDCYLYRLHAGSLSTAKQERVLSVTATSLLRHLPKLNWAQPEAKGFACFRAGLQILQNGQVNEAARAIRAAIIDYGVLSHHRDYVAQSILYSPSTPNSKEAYQQTLALLPRGSDVRSTVTQLFKSGRVVAAMAILNDWLLTQSPQDPHLRNLVQNLLFEPDKLRPENEFCQLMSMLPDDYRPVHEFRRYLKGQYYGIRCFEAGIHAKNRRSIQDFGRAIRYNWKWIGNRGFLRLALEATLSRN